MNIVNIHLKLQKDIILIEKIKINMQILVKSDKTIALDVEKTETIFDIKNRIRKIRGGCPFATRITWSGKQLNNDKTLEYYKIYENATLNLVGKLCPKEHIYKHPKHNCFEVYPNNGKLFRNQKVKFRLNKCCKDYDINDYHISAYYYTLKSRNPAKVKIEHNLTNGCVTVIPDATWKYEIGSMMCINMIKNNRIVQWYNFKIETEPCTIIVNNTNKQFKKVILKRDTYSPYVELSDKIGVDFSSVYNEKSKSLVTCDNDVLKLRNLDVIVVSNKVLSTCSLCKTRVGTGFLDCECKFGPVCSTCFKDTDQCDSCNTYLFYFSD